MGGASSVNLCINPLINVKDFSAFAKKPVQDILLLNIQYCQNIIEISYNPIQLLSTWAGGSQMLLVGRYPASRDWWQIVCFDWSTLTICQHRSPFNHRETDKQSCSPSQLCRGRSMGRQGAMHSTGTHRFIQGKILATRKHTLSLSLFLHGDSLTHKLTNPQRITHSDLT